MTPTASSFEAAKAAIPASLRNYSGKVFYAGRSAYNSPAAMYILGVNPGGDPDTRQDETVASHTEWVATTAPEGWSAYRDESWKGKPPGRHGMQPRILHMFKAVALSPGAVPASNLVFVRSRRESDIAVDIDRLVGECWPFHKYVIETLRPKVVLCLGKTAGDHVLARVGAHSRYATFTESNSRKWQSHAYRTVSGLKVVVATHPSIADWSTPASDPTPIIADALHDA